MRSHLSVSRADLVRLWQDTAKLQDAAGKRTEAKHSRDAAKRTQGVNAWLGRR